MNEVTRIAHRSAEIVKLWGKARLSNGETLEEALTISGISFWDVIAPTFTANCASMVLSQNRNATLLKSPALFLHRCKRKLFDAVLPLLGNSEGCRQWPEKPAVLFLGFSHYMFRETLDSVAKRISRRNDCSSVVLIDSFNAKSLCTYQDGILFNSIWQHWGRETASESCALRKDFEKVVDEIKQDNSFSEIIMDGERALFPFLKNALYGQFEAFAPRLINQMAIALHILTDHRPKLIISPDVNDPRTRLYTLLGQKLNIPSLEVQLSFYTRNDVEWQFFIADHLAVTGEVNLDVMSSHGIPKEKMTVTGSARYDALADYTDEEKKTKRLELGVLDKDTMIVFASQPHYYGVFNNAEIRIKMINDLFDSVGKIDGLKLVVKPHPMENVRDLKRLAGREKNIIFAEKHSDIRDLIGISDAFTTFFSNAAFDALARNKPTIILAFPDSSGCTVFEKSGAVLVAKSKEDILIQLKAIMQGLPSEHMEKTQSARNRFLEQWLYRIDGRSAERIESLAFAVAKSKKEKSLLRE